MTSSWLARRAVPAAILIAIGLALPASSLAHGPDPLLPGAGTLWPRDAVVQFQWGVTPPAWAGAAMDAGAADVSESRSSRAAVFVRVSSAPASLTYGPTQCDSFGIACMDRTGMTSGIFRIWFRPQGYAFDWGTLKWCQSYDSAPNGCYDIETTTLDELGHVEILGHHVNYADESDFTDAVVQYAGHVKPKAGWNQHVYGRCDVATLQLKYERRDPSNPVSTCLSLPTAMTFGVDSNTIVAGDVVRFSATLKLAVNSVADAMSGDLLSERPVLLQRKAIGSTTWTTVATMVASPTTEGAYSLTIGPLATYDWRATFATPTTEGVLGSTTTPIRITVSSCTGGGCPLSVVRGGG